jgi:putative ABC transport system permease protein
VSDLRDALRSLRSTPVVSAVAMLSLALGIGANTAIFSLLDSVMLRSLPVREPQGLVMLASRSWTNPIWEQIRDRQDRFSDGAFAWSQTRFDLAEGGESVYANGIYASGRFFEVLGVPAVLGRTFTPHDDVRRGGPEGPVAVIGYGFWQRRFGGAANVVGRTVTLDRVPFTIVGVTGPDFFGPDVGRTFDVVIPIGAEPLLRPDRSALDQRSWWWLSVMARLKPGQTASQATAALRAVQPQIREATLPDRWRPERLGEYLKEPFTLESAATGASGLRERYERPILVLMIVVALVLLIACANIANLMLARTTARRHELSVRLALGASRGRLARQLLSESLVLAAAGAALGVAFARWGSALLVQQLSTPTSRVFLDMPLDLRVLGFTTTVAVTTALLFGTVPALRASRVEPNESLKDQGRGGSARRHAGVGPWLVAAQVALSVVLVVAAGLFMRTFSSLAGRDLGFDRDPVLIVTIDAQRSSTPMEGRVDLFERVHQAAGAVPGVAHAALSAVTPVSNMTWNNLVDIPGGPPLSEEDRITNINYVTPGWFATYGTRLLAGRDVTDRDRQGAQAVALVNETFVKKLLGGGHAIGRTLRQQGRPGKVEPPIEIVGVVRDAVYESLREPVPPTMYLPFAQVDASEAMAVSSVNLSVRAARGTPGALARPVLAAVSRVDPNLSLAVRTLAAQVDASLTQERLLALLSGFFGALALLLAGIGLYGVTSYGVSRRRSEIGVRMALGAEPGAVVRMVLRQVGLLVGAGVLAGGLASLWAGRYARTLLYGLEPRDPWTLATSAAVLFAVGALAGWLPARRAARIDPARVLRDE